MNKESQVSESAALERPSVVSQVFSRKNKLSGFIFSILAAVFEFFSFIIMKTVHGAVIFGTTFQSRVIAPIGVGLAVLKSLSGDTFINLRDDLRCLAHRATVMFLQIRKNRIVLSLTLLATTLLIISATFYSVGIKIIANGEELGYMYSRAEYDEAVSFVEARASEILERPYSVTTPVRFELGIVPREKVISKNAIRSYFFSQIDEVSELYAITVDGEVIGASRNRETLQKMLDELLYTSDPNVKARFAQDVSITQKYVDASKLLSYEEIREKLTSTTRSTKTYTIKSGDTVSKIAKANGMTTSALYDLNPSLRSGRLRAGDSVTVAKEVPLLSVEAVRHVTYTETIPYETQKVNDSSIYKGSSKVVVRGRVGTRSVVADVTYVDNKEVSREILSSQVTQNPVTEVIHVGTKTPPKTAATGKLSRPVSGGIISSNYGMRRGSMHKGVDFAAASGTRISAADGGTVTWAGWKRGGWGYLVVINHGNGLETYYAHNSKVLVSVGQKVSKGQQIAKMGSTGNSSGPHCHFEIHKNGRYVNPWNYIK